MGFRATRNLWENVQHRHHNPLIQTSDTGVPSHQLSASRDVNSAVYRPGMLWPAERGSSRDLQMVLSWKQEVLRDMGRVLTKWLHLTRSPGTSQDPTQGLFM